MKIKVNLGNIGQAIKAIEQYRDSLPKKQRLFLQKLAEKGIETAEVKFREAVYDGTNDVSVGLPYWVSDNCVAVRAVGKSVTFIEFGAGVYYGGHHEKAQELGFIRGEYGKKQGKHSYWLYKGEEGTNGVPSTAAPGMTITHGNPPNRCMWEAGKTIRANILKTAKEVFGSD